VNAKRLPETWLFDLGNSRLKGARLVDGSPAAVFALDWERHDVDRALAAECAAWPRPDRVLVASVAAAGRAGTFRDAVGAWPDARVEWLQSPRRGCGIVNSYADPVGFGIDRFLSLVAVRARTRGAAIVAGCGTALTIDAIDAGGVHRGGLIAPSPRLMLAGLRGATAIGEFDPDAFRDTRPDDTARALHSGCWGAAGALVEWFLARRRGEWEGDALWLHGGWARPLAEWLERDGCRAQVIDDAVLAGLALWADAHSPGATVS
jgi:type III pantothenate kinase